LPQLPKLKPQEAPEQLSIPPVAATVLPEAVGLTLPAQVATAPLEALEREPRGEPGPALYLPAATAKRLPAERLRDLPEPPAPKKSGLQGLPRRRCRTANRLLRARVLADKSALVRRWP
jgi:hypothetical protein